MGVMIRLARQGAKKKPQFQIVVQERNSKRDGAYLAKLGYYYPKALNVKDKLKVDLDKLMAWKAKGATMTQTVGQLLKTLSK